MRRGSARLECDHHHIGADVERPRGDTNGLHDAHAASHQVVGQVGRAGEVVGDATKKNLCSHAQRTGGLAGGSSMPGKILITALSSSLAKPALEACMNIWCAVE